MLLDELGREGGVGHPPGGKPRPNHGVYLRMLRAMTPEQRLRKAFELGAMARVLFEHGPNLIDAREGGALRRLRAEARTTE